MTASQKDPFVQTPLKLNDMFSRNTTAERVKALIATEFFQGAWSLHQSYSLLKSLIEKHPNVPELSEVQQLINKSRRVVINPIWQLIYAQGYTGEELSAALMVSEGRVILE